MSVEFLKWEDFESTALSSIDNNWTFYKDRWEYYAKTIDILKTLNLKDPKEVLEIGPLDNSLVVGSDSMDYVNDRWKSEKGKTYIHDIRKIPWGIEDKKYKVCVALRVFHHISPHQEKCFIESSRVADHLILVVPIKTKSKVHYDSFSSLIPNCVLRQAENIKFNNSKLYHWSFCG